MSNDYNVDDILSEIKSKKSKQGKGNPVPGVPEKINPRSDFQIDEIGQFAKRPSEPPFLQKSTTPPAKTPSAPFAQDIPPIPPTPRQTKPSFGTTFQLEPESPQQKPQNQAPSFQMPAEDFSFSPPDPEPDLLTSFPPKAPPQAEPPFSPSPKTPTGKNIHIQKPEEHTQVFQTPNLSKNTPPPLEQPPLDEPFPFVGGFGMPEPENTSTQMQMEDDVPDFPFTSFGASAPSATPMQDTAPPTPPEPKPKKTGGIRSFFHKMEEASVIPNTQEPPQPAQPNFAPPPQEPQNPQQPDYQQFFSNMDMDFDPAEDGNNGIGQDDFSNGYTVGADFNLDGGQTEPSPFQNQETSNMSGFFSGAESQPNFSNVSNFAAEDENLFRVQIPDEEPFETASQPTMGSPSFQQDIPTNAGTGLFGNQDNSADSISGLTNADIPIPDSAEDDDEIEDYTSPKDKEAIINDMKNIKVGLFIRILICFVVFGISLYLSCASRNIVVGGYLLPLPEFMIPEQHFRTYMVVSTLMVALSALICSNTVGGGILSLLKFHADSDALPSLAVLGSMAQGVCFIVRPDFFDAGNLDGNLYFFFPVAILVLVFNLIGKLMVILRIQNNFKIVASERSKNAVNFLTHKDVIREVSKGMSLEEYAIAYPEKAHLLSHFLDNSYSEDHAERISRGLAPACLVAAILSSVLSFIFNKNGAEAVTTFTAVLCICAPLTSSIAANFPLLRLSSKLVPAGAMVAGYSSVDTFSKTEAVILNACDIFRPENVVLHGIKAFDQGKIDAVILDAASVVCSTNGMLTAVFSKIIGANKSMLKPVENITYEDSMGLSAWVDGKRVLIGNRDLLMNHGIEVPSNDYEMRYVKDSKNIIYLSNSGELTAMFVISYHPNAEMQEQLNRLAGQGMYLVVETSDPNITAEKIRDAYQFPIEQIKILPARVHQVYLNLTKERESASSKIGFMGNGVTMLRAILDCIFIRSSISQSVLMQMIALVLGYGIITLFTLMGNLTMIRVSYMLLYQVIWAVLIMVIPNIKRL